MVKISDLDGVLNEKDMLRLARFIVEHCYSTTEDIEWLTEIVLRNDGACKYAGYWECDYDIDDARNVVGFSARIFLNTGWLTAIEDMEETLAHEYGHHWTLGHLLTRGRLPSDDPDCPAPGLYCRLRRLDSTKFRGTDGDDSYDQWLLCDKEVMAEDYRHLLTERPNGHEMEPIIGLPSTEVREYFRTLGAPRWLACPTCPPLTLE